MGFTSSGFYAMHLPGKPLDCSAKDHFCIFAGGEFPRIPPSLVRVDIIPYKLSE